MFSQIKVFTDKVVPKGMLLPCAIEQFPSKDFFKNECGWTRNDIAVLAAATSKSQYDAIVQRLVERPTEYNLKPDTKLSDALKVITPRWCQSPKEIEAFAEYAANLQLADIDAQYKDIKPDIKAESESSEVEKSE